MKRLIRFFYNKINDRKIKITLFVAILYQFLNFLEMCKEKVQFSLYDVIISQFDYLSLFFMLSIVFLIVIYNINSNSEFGQYLLLRFSDKKQYFDANVIVVFITSFLYVFMFNLLSFIECIGRISMKNNWSQFFLNVNADLVNIDTFLSYFTPLKYTMILNVLVFLYFSTLGMIFLMIHSIFNKRSITLIITIGIICLNMASDSTRILSDFTFTNNIFILNSTNFIFSNFIYFFKRLAYWMFILISSYLTGLIITIKKDYKYEC